MPFGRKRTTGSRPRRSFTGSSAASRRRCPGVFVCRPARAGRRLPQAAGRSREPRGSRGSAIAIGSGKTRVFDWALERPRRQVGRACPRATSPSRSPRRPSFRPTGTGLEQILGDDSIPDRRVQDPVGQGRADHAHGAGQLADGPQRDSARATVRRKPRRVRWRRSTTW